MKKIFKTLSAGILSGLVLCGSFMLSGCSDFAFNPIGEWVCTKAMDNGENVKSIFGDITSVETCYVFRHNGTAYMKFNGEPLENEYTYTYDDNKIILQDINNKNEHIEYTVSDDGNSFQYSPSEGTIRVFERK